jgi:hypothetical protein
MAIGFIVVFGGGTYAAAHLGSWMAGIDAPPAHTIDLIAGLIKGRVPWPGRGTISEVGGRRELGAGFLLDEVLNEGLLDSEDGVVFSR